MECGNFTIYKEILNQFCHKIYNMSKAKKGKAPVTQTFILCQRLIMIGKDNFSLSSRQENYQWIQKVPSIYWIFHKQALYRNKLKLFPENLDLYLPKRIEASIVEFKSLDESLIGERMSDQTLKKLGRVLNSANKVHTLDIAWSE